MRFLSAEALAYFKGTASATRAGVERVTPIKFFGQKDRARVAIVSVDGKGNVIQRNSRGEKFYLSPVGDMVFVK